MGLGNFHTYDLHGGNRNAQNTHAAQRHGHIMHAGGGGVYRRNLGFFRAFSHFLSLILCVIVLIFLVLGKETRNVFGMDITAKWSDSKALRALVIVSSICLGYSFIQLIYCCLSFRVAFRTRFPRPRAIKWTIFFMDQVLAYALLATASASAEAGYLAKNGFKSATWEPLCPSFGGFCRNLEIALLSSFFATLALAANAIMSVYDVAQ